VEDTTIDPSVQGTGVYTVHAVYYAATAADQYHGSATLEDKPAPQPTPTPSNEAAPRYQNYPAPPALGNSAGEPSIGSNWDSGNSMFIASLQTLRVKWDDSGSPATATWEDVSAANTSVVTSDPILFMDSQAGPNRTNRTFASQLLGKTSLMSYSDDDGATWHVSQGSGINSGVDHQTVGAGPYARRRSRGDRAQRRRWFHFRSGDPDVDAGAVRRLTRAHQGRARWHCVRAEQVVRRQTRRRRV
jgi:hypothetical protein